MLSHLVSRTDIAEAQAALEATMRREFSDSETRTITFPAGRVLDAQVMTDGHYWYYPHFDPNMEVGTPRMFNWFGILRPGHLRITLEANVVPEGQNPHVRGFFARHPATGALYLMHTGDVAGGAPGVRGRAFRAWHAEPRDEVYDPAGDLRFGFCVMELNALAATRSLVRYVNRIDAFREAVRNRQVRVDDPNFQREMQELDDFYEEPRGRRTKRGTGQVDYLSRHGDVVDALHDWREQRGLERRHRVVKNVFIDMGVANARGRLVELYEVKTSAARSDVYCAIGQLIVHGPPSCERVIVLPHGERLADDLCEALQRNRIALLRFTLDGESVTITDAGPA